MNKFSKITLTLLLICYFLNKIFNIKDDSIKYIDIVEPNGCIALNYHRVRERDFLTQTLEKITQNNELTLYSVYSDDFEKQMDTLIEAGAYFARLDELKEFRENNSYPEKCVWISFDDVDKTVYENAYPILKERGIPFTLFVISDKVGLKDFQNLKMSTWDDLREMRDSGLVSFGSHTHDMHYWQNGKAIFLNEEYYSQFNDDIKKSKEVIEEELDVLINTIAYPFGESNPEITEIVKSNGYTEAFILNAQPITANNNQYYQNRYLLYKEFFDKVIVNWLNH